MKKLDPEKRKMDNLPPLYPFHPTTSNNVPPPNDHPMLMFDDNLPNLELPTLPSSISEPNPINQAQFGDDVSGINDILNYDILSDPYILGLINEPIDNVYGNYGDGGASSSTRQRIPLENVLMDHVFGNSMKLSVWPVSPEPYVCSCCLVLREIKFYNGKHVRKLEVHGRVGSIYHAIMDKFDYDNISSENHEYLMFDFCNESTDAVRNFLLQYCEQCRKEGYTLAPDPLSKFYEALCVGLNENVAVDYNNTSFQSSPMDSGDLHSNQQDSEGDDVRNAINKEKEIATGSSQERSFLAAQRERTGKLKLEDFSAYFRLPMNDAAKMMNVCPTVIKKKCREGGMTRWPHRKIKGIEKQILKKKEELMRATFEEKANIFSELQMLEQELAKIFGKQ